MSHSVVILLISVLGNSYVELWSNISINKLNSQKDEEQKASGNYFFLES